MDTGSPKAVVGFGTAANGVGLHTQAPIGRTRTTTIIPMDGTCMMATGVTMTTTTITGTITPITESLHQQRSAA
jgi:hypothetical protein